jgi:hypothetical protein
MKILDALTDKISSDIHAISGIYQPFTNASGNDLRVEPEQDVAVPDDEIGEIGQRKPYTITQFFEEVGLTQAISEEAEQFLNSRTTDNTPTLWQLFKAAEHAIHTISADTRRQTKIDHTRSIEKLVVNPEELMTIADKGWNIKCDGSTGSMGINDGQVNVDENSGLAILADDENKTLADKHQDFRSTQQELSELVDEFTEG